MQSRLGLSQFGAVNKPTESGRIADEAHARRPMGEGAVGALPI